MDRSQPGWRTPDGRRRRRLLGAALMVAALPGIASCGQQEQRSAQNLCARYQELVAQADAVRALPPRTTTSDTIRARADAALVKLDQLQAVSEGRYDTLISTLRAAINDVKQSAANAGATAAQARAETLQQVAESVAPLKQRLDVQCS